MRERDRRFYTGMAVAALLAAFAGFARTYFLKTITGAPAVSPLVHVHAAAFSAWMLLLVAQTTLVAAGRTGLHRRLGVAGAALAGAMIVLGTMTAIAAARHGHKPALASDPLAFLAISLGDLSVFVVLAGAGLWLRRQPETHKRLMLLATVGGLLPAAIARIPGISGHSPRTAAVTAAFLLAGPIYDWASRRRVHPVYLWACPAIVLYVPLRLVVGQTDAWHRFAAWLIR